MKKLLVIIVGLLIIALLGFALLLTFGLATQSLPTHYAVGPNAYAQLYGIDDGDGNVIPYQPTKVTKPATTQTTTNTTKTTTTIKPAISDTELLKDVKNIRNDWRANNNKNYNATGTYNATTHTNTRHNKSTNCCSYRKYISTRARTSAI